MKNGIMTRVLSLLLAGLMMASLAACGDTNTDTPGDTTTETKPQAEETLDPKFTDDLPELNYNNKTISILASQRNEVVDELFTENKAGELISEAVHKRNVAVEERMGVKLDIHVEGAADTTYVPTKINTMILAGDSEYQIASGPSYTMMQYAVQGDYLDLATLGNLNLEKEYWSQGYNEVVSWGEDHQYLASGAIALSLFRFMYITLYDRDALADYQLQDPYDLVQNNEWTMDKQIQLVSNIYTDSGNSTRDDQDYYGFVSGAGVSTDGIWTATDVHIVDKDENNELVYVTDQSKLRDVVDKTLTLYNSKGSFIYEESMDGSDTNNIIDMFAGKKALMINAYIYRIEKSLRDYDGEYGIVPMPKFDTNQKNYRTCIQDKVSAFAVPNTVPAEDQNMIGAVLECMASESYKTTVDAYYNTALSSRYMENPESKVMLDLAYDSVVMTAHQIYCSTVKGKDGVGVLTLLRHIVESNENTVTSTFKSSSKMLASSVQDINKAYNDFLNPKG